MSHHQKQNKWILTFLIVLEIFVSFSSPSSASVVTGGVREGNSGDEHCQSKWCTGERAGGGHASTASLPPPPRGQLLSPPSSMQGDSGFCQGLLVSSNRPPSTGHNTLVFLAFINGKNGRLEPVAMHVPRGCGPTGYGLFVNLSDKLSRNVMRVHAECTDAGGYVNLGTGAGGRT